MAPPADHGAEHREGAAALAPFRKRDHLRGTVRIRTVVTTGKAMHEAPFKLVGLRCPLPDPVPVQVAFAVPRRNLPRAVDRNRMKRLMREAWRRSRAQLPANGPSPGEQLALLFIYQGREVIAHPEVITKIDRLLRRWLEKHGG